MTNNNINLKNKIKSLVKEELSTHLSETRRGASNEPYFEEGYRLGQEDITRNSWGNIGRRLAGLIDKPRGRKDALEFERGYVEAMREKIDSMRATIDSLYEKMEKEAMTFEDNVLESQYPEQPKNIW